MPDPAADGSVTILIGSTRHPIVIDMRQQLSQFLRDRLPPEDVLFAREMRSPPVNPIQVYSEIYEPPYPPLPPIKIGELQWPSGASRYARALYAVDRITMEAVAAAAWGWEPELDGEDPLPLDDVPSNWGTASLYAVGLTISDQQGNDFHASMYALRPYRVPSTGADLWLLPLVDRRWIDLHKPASVDHTAESWSALLTSLSTGTTLNVGSIAAGFGTPADTAVSTASPHSQPERKLLDVMALSVGLRVVCDPADGELYAKTATQSVTDRDDRLTAIDPTLVAGGLSGNAVIPQRLKVYSASGASSSASLTGGTALNWTESPAWTTWNDDETRSAMASAVGTAASNWRHGGGQYAIAGPVSNGNLHVNGFDDFLSIEICEPESARYVFRTRFYELPGLFLPRLLFPGPNRPSELFSFTLLEDMGTTFAGANIFTLDGTAIEPPDPLVPLTVENTLGQFGHLELGDSGLCYFYDGKYYITHPEDANPAATLLSTFTLTANLAAGVGETASATVGITTDGGLSPGDTITVRNTGGYRSYSGLTGLAIKTNNQWWIVEVDQHCLLFYATLSSNTHNLSTSAGNIPGKVSSQITIELQAAEALTPYPFSHLPGSSDPETGYTGITVTNPQNFFGKAGDKVLVAHKRSTDANEIVALYPAFARSIYALFDEAAPNGLTPSIQASPLYASPLGSVGEISGSSFSAKDKFYRAHNAQSGDRVLVVKNEVTSEWEILECEHNAIVVRGVTTGAVATTDATFTVNTTQGLDGNTPAGSTLTVQNNGQAIPTSVTVLIRWDPITGQWRILEAPNPQGIVNIRIVGETFEYTKDGITWTPWHTGEEDCPPP